MSALGKIQKMTPAEGQDLAVRAFTFLADDPARIERFLALTGLNPAELRAHIDSPAFLAGVLEHILQDETLLLTFSAEAHIDPASVAVARHIIDTSQS
jgi:hypothetical protein